MIEIKCDNCGALLDYDPSGNQLTRTLKRDGFYTIGGHNYGVGDHKYVIIDVRVGHPTREKAEFVFCDKNCALDFLVAKQMILQEGEQKA